MRKQENRKPKWSSVGILIINYLDDRLKRDSG